LIAKLNETNITYYHPDHLGSSSVMSNEGGAVTSESVYLPFGLESSVMGPEPKYGFTRKELDETELQYFGARYYDPETGRFLNIDPLLQYASPYVYCGNNPLNCVDPDGRRGRQLWPYKDFFEARGATQIEFAEHKARYEKYEAGKSKGLMDRILSLKQKVPGIRLAKPDTAMFNSILNRRFNEKMALYEPKPLEHDSGGAGDLLVEGTAKGMGAKLTADFAGSLGGDSEGALSSDDSGGGTPTQKKVKVLVVDGKNSKLYKRRIEWHLGEEEVEVTAAFNGNNAGYIFNGHELIFANVWGDYVPRFLREINKKYPDTCIIIHTERHEGSIPEDIKYDYYLNTRPLRDLKSPLKRALDTVKSRRSNSE